MLTATSSSEDELSVRSNLHIDRYRRVGILADDGDLSGRRTGHRAHDASDLRTRVRQQILGKQHSHDSAQKHERIICFIGPPY